MSEHVIMREVRAAAGIPIWRNNVGKFWTIPPTATCAHCGGNLLGGGAIRGASITSCGLGLGSADLIGVQLVNVTPEMVGSPIGRFVGLEVKTANGRVRPEQAKWREVVRRHGAVAEIVRSADDAVAVLRRSAGPT